MVQRLRLSAPSAGGLGLLSGQRTRSCMLQLRPGTAKKKKKKILVVEAEAIWWGEGTKIDHIRTLNPVKKAA